jgi:hypothetical protein
MKATLVFDLDMGEAEAHQTALDGPKWRIAMANLDQFLRNNLKHTGVRHHPKLPEVRAFLHRELDQAGLKLYD